MAMTCMTQRRTPRRRLAAVLLLGCLALSPAVRAQDGASPHWKKDGCTACHTGAAPTAANLMLKTTPGDAVCSECHGDGEASVCRHRSGFAVSAERVADFDEALQAGIRDGELSCTTCHELKPHCERDVKQRYRNPSFLRGGAFEDRSDQCYACHSKRDYKQRSPHRQVRKDQIIEGACAFCHGAVPQQDAAGQWLPVQFATSGPQSKLCSGCHRVGPHPSSSVTGKTGWFHMSVPPAEMATRMEHTVVREQGSLPLDPSTGEITCTTCHNPHDRKLEGLRVAKTPGNRSKLRYDDICGACHEK